MSTMQLACMITTLGLTALCAVYAGLAALDRAWFEFVLMLLAVYYVISTYADFVISVAFFGSQTGWW